MEWDSSNLKIVEIVEIVEIIAYIDRNFLAQPVIGFELNFARPICELSP